jgi:hypothetical protein
MARETFNRLRKKWRVKMGQFDMLIMTLGKRIVPRISYYVQPMEPTEEDSAPEDKEKN